MLYKDFGVQVELGDMYNILALISIGTSKHDVNKLIKSLVIISNITNEKMYDKKINIKQIAPRVKLSPRDAFYSMKESIDLDKSENKICAESIMAYPPGIPIVSPGEIITREIIDYIKLLKENNAHLTDMKDKELKTVLVVKE